MMNRKIFLSTMILLATTSCSKKNWICTCTSNNNGTIVEVSNYTLTESDAISACTNKDNEPDITCTLLKK